jgi:predicted DNA repair protein MutK
VIEEPLDIQIPVVSVVAIVATIGVYGLVALLVRMDDMGYKLIAMNKSEKSFSKTVGKAMVKTLPFIIRGLGVLGTLAMILVGGGIFVHNIHYIHDLVHGLPTILGEFIVGLVVGIIALLIVKAILKIIGKKPAH